MDYVSKQLIKELAKKNNISVEAMMEIQEAPYQFLRYVMSHEVDRERYIYPSVRILGLGIFHCPDHVKEKFKKKDETFRNEKLEGDST